MTTGQQIKNRRKEKGMTQEELAEKLSVSRSTVSNWEIDRNYPDIKIIISISKVLDIPLEELLGEGSSVVEKISEDTRTRAKLSRKLRCMYAAGGILILLSVFLAVMAFGTKEISSPEQIKSAEVKSGTLYVTADLPFYRSVSGWYMDQGSDGEAELTVITRLSPGHKENIEIPFDEKWQRSSDRIQFTSDGKTYREVRIHASDRHR